MSTPSSTVAVERMPVEAPNAAVGQHGQGMNKAVRITYLGLLVLALVAPLIGLSPVFVMKVLCFALFACAFNLLLGFTGLLSFGHAAFFGFAAYVTGWFVKQQNWTPELGVLAGVVSAALLGLIVVQLDEGITTGSFAVRSSIMSTRSSCRTRRCRGHRCDRVTRASRAVCRERRSRPLRSTR